VKTLRPGATVALTGYYTQSGMPSPFDGAATMRADGSVMAGVFVHALATGANNFTVEWTTDPTLAGAAKYDADGDFQADGTLTLTTIDCASVPAP
jgi:hypothetical protein